MLYEPVRLPEASTIKQTSRFALILGAHILALGLLLTAVSRPEIKQALLSVQVRLLEMRHETPQPEAAKPLPTPKPPKKTEAKPPPIMVARQPAATSASFTVTPQPEAKAVDTVATPAPPAPITPARFDAAYLQNPKPAYPSISRRLEEQGRVVLRVRVSEQGSALSVEVKQSSGFIRLDDAARSAVERWRFVPAKQGNEAIEAWVLVPLHFTLDN